MACGRLLERMFVTVIYFLAMDHHKVKGQLNLYITKEHLNNDLRLNFQSSVHMITNGLPSVLLRSPQAFYHLVSPISPVVKELSFSWYSDPQKEHYSITIKSSDTKIMADPILSIKSAGIVPQSLSAFKVSFACSGIKAGIADLIFALNYTRIKNGIIDQSSIKRLKFRVRRYCNESVEVTLPGKTTKKPPRMSRAVIVGVCAGVTILLCLCIGALILCRYNTRQKKLHMEFKENSDLETRSKKKGLLNVVNMMSSKEKDEPPMPPDSPPIYSPKRRHPDKGHYPAFVHSPPRKMFPKPSTKHRQRLGSSSSICSTAPLMDIVEENESESTSGNVSRKEKAKNKKVLWCENVSCEDANLGSCSNDDQSLIQSSVEQRCSSLEENSSL